MTSQIRTMVGACSKSGLSPTYKLHYAVWAHSNISGNPDGSWNSAEHMSTQFGTLHSELMLEEAPGPYCIIVCINSFLVVLG